MSPLWAFFGLGPVEILILAAMGVVPLVMAGVAVVVVLRATRKKRDGEDE